MTPAAPTAKQAVPSAIFSPVLIPTRACRMFSADHRTGTIFIRDRAVCPVANPFIALKLDVLVRSLDVSFRGQAGRLFESNYKILIGFVCCKTIPNALAPKFLMTMARDYVANYVSENKAND